MSGGQILMLAILALAFTLVMFLSINSDLNEHERNQSHRQLMREIRNKDRDGKSPSRMTERYSNGKR